MLASEICRFRCISDALDTPATIMRPIDAPAEVRVGIEIGTKLDLSLFVYFALMHMED